MHCGGVPPSCYEAANAASTSTFKGTVHNYERHHNVASRGPKYGSWYQSSDLYASTLRDFLPWYLKSALIQVRAKHCFYSSRVLILKHACKMLHHKHCFYSSLANVNMLALSCIFCPGLNFSFFFACLFRVLLGKHSRNLAVSELSTVHSKHCCIILELNPC